MVARLLPGNATELERLAAQALAQIERVPVPLRDLWNPDACPVALLPYLAWAFSVDRWSQAWPESAKRNAIEAAYFIHSRKGTIGALRRVVEPLGYLIEVREWWEELPLGVPGTFRLLIGVLETGITEAMYQELSWLIDDAKPLSRHLIELAISLESKLTAYIGVAVVDGDELDVYPWQNSDIEVVVRAYVGVTDSINDEMDVYPWST
ncbi:MULTISPECIES: phage tail protein I [unclassified Pseudomonas]|uniref:phage tail protein I n=1 Tax=unclassified Pseudomonas TaxID=196821 RepID=UPI000357B3C6|nr:MULTISPECIES: phage tail protein I [unclassified Pseudomonas]OKP74036.1 phage tail protein I [Pseudomonas fluorescens]EPJ83235.1 tail protein I [Pseudomonas sp. CFT9]PMX16190.1 phage tail protein I [Pseudomonas sp. MPBC4-3]PMX49026.1 phage tail protein I [Pseudomonas sp. FW301-21B01]PMY08056.1 phage tail protein I [Pseudomonas sp. MPR-R5A]